MIDKILRAYADIADLLPRMDRLKSTFGDTAEFHQVLGLIYSDIIEFHQRAYKIFRRRAWHVWFAFDWGLFERRFKGILSRLASHCDLLDKEAASLHFLDMKATRDKRIRDDEAFEQHRQNRMTQDVLTWLSAAEDNQADYLHGLADHRQLGTCNFILQDPQVSSWADSEVGPDVIWMTGIPGAGKSYLCSSIIQNLQTRHETSSVYYFCGQKSMERDSCALVLRTLLNQLLRQNLDLAPLIHEAYLMTGSNKSAPAVKRMLKEVLSEVKCTRIILDGVDECDETIQREILANLADVQKSVGISCKILVSSRHEPLIKKSIPQKCHIALDGKTTESLNIYIRSRVSGLKSSFPDTGGLLWDTIEQKLMEKAKGMFLWVRLVITTLEQQICETDLEAAIEELPDGLDEAYGRILSRIRSLAPREKDRAFRILFWVCTAYRPISIHEVADGIALKPGQTVLSKKTRSANVNQHILDFCAPLLERLSRGILDVVHFSAKEYILDLQSGPFVDIAQAHFNAAFACIVNLNATLGIVPRYNHGDSDEYFETMIVSGAYGLQQYGHDYWAEHTVAYLELLPELNGQSLALVKALEDFSKVCRRQEPCDLQQAYSKTGKDLAKAWATLHKLDRFPRVQNLILGWFRFKSKLEGMASDLDGLQAQEQWKLSEDGTFLSLIDSRMRNLRERLLSTPNSAIPAHIDEVEHKAFLARYRFACRFLGCTHESECETARDRHEASCRTTLFPCSQCDFSGRGFRTRRMLEQHTRTYHMAPEDFEIPPSLAAARNFAGTSVSGAGASCSSTSGSNCWNAQGRKIIQQTFQKVLSRVESDMTLLDRGGEGQDTDFNGREFSHNPNLVISTASLADIRVKINAQQYQTLKEFKDNLWQALKDPRTLTTSDSLDDLEGICNQELEKASSGFPCFANCLPISSSSSPSKAVPESAGNFTDTVRQSEGNPAAVLKPYWSVAEEADFSSLVQQHGRNLNKISEYLMTKSPKDVEDHLNELVASGRHDLTHLADPAEAAKQQDSEQTMLDPDTGSNPPMESMTETAINDATVVADSSTTEGINNDASFVVRPDALLNYRKHIIPTATAVSKPHSQTPQTDKVTSTGKSKRRPPPKSKGMCPYCRTEFRDEYAVAKHVERRHEATRKAWICEDVSLDKKFLANCKSCSGTKRYGTRHNVFKHLRSAHFTATTPMETLLRWVKETEGPNFKSDKKHSEWLSKNHPERLPAHWQAPKRRKTAKDLPSLELSTHDAEGGQFYLPPMQDLPTEISAASQGSTPLEYSTNDTSLTATPDPSKPSQPRKRQHLVTTDGFLPDVSFDNFLPRSSTMNPRAVSTQGFIAHKALIRPDQVFRLPHLNEFQRATCQDQVEALYETLNKEPPTTQAHEEAMQMLKSLSQELIKGIRLWRQQNSFAPAIPFSF